MYQDSNTIFKKAVKGNNIMTPNFIRYANTSKYVVELTQGRGMDNEDIFGVTVVNKETGKRELEVDQMFFSREFAEAYIADLK